MSDTLWDTLKSSSLLTIVEGTSGGIGGIGGGDGSSRMSGGGGGSGSGGGVNATMSAVVTSGSISTAESLLNSQLASALMGSNDAKYLEDSISPSTARQQLTSVDPSNLNSAPTLLKAMKWLLASVSKGRDVSDFFPNVVKLVACPSLEVRKMVYVYLQHYANYNAACRELALLSINAFQRGLADSEQWIRALALRVLTCIHVPDVLQIQVLAVQTCSVDSSPYVRKCAANALAKLYPRCDDDIPSQELLLEILRKLLEQDDSSSLVLSSVMYSFLELCPERLDLLHQSYRKLCTWLVDMDDAGQVVLLDILSRYCRRFFQQPDVLDSNTQSAQLIDKQRRVRRSPLFPPTSSTTNTTTTDTTSSTSGDPAGKGSSSSGSHNNHDSSSARNMRMITKVKRRVVRKAFYSDEEDQSSEEEVNVCAHTGQPIVTSLATAMRQDQVLGFGSGVAGIDANVPIPSSQQSNNNNKLPNGSVEFGHLHKDHALLLKSSLPLLRSRNSAVVMAVASLHYYCGIPSIAIRSAIGKALVRIYHDRREIQYVVLTSIQILVQDCPSAFTPYLHDFFVKGMDPSFTRIIKLDILTFLALEPNSIQAVLHELKTYVRHPDKTFVAASIQTVAKIAQLARNVHDRHGIRVSNTHQARHDANHIALHCLQGITTITYSSDDNPLVLEQCLSSMQHILLLLLSNHPTTNIITTTTTPNNNNNNVMLQDPNHIIATAIRRILLFVIRSLDQQPPPTTTTTTTTTDETTKSTNPPNNDNDNNDSLMSSSMTNIQKNIVLLPSDAIAPALWLLGEYLTTNSNTKHTTTTTIPKIHLYPKFHKRDIHPIRLNLLRLQAKSFCHLHHHNKLKLQCIHFATKCWLYSATTTTSEQQSQSQQEEQALAEFILGCGRVDLNVDVRDCARYESALLNHTASGLKYDTDHLSPDNDTTTSTQQKWTLQQTKDIILQFKPPSSWLPLDYDTMNNHKEEKFRFGTLSSLVSHKAGNAYSSLPPWANQDSPTSLRDPPPPKPTNNNDKRRNVTGLPNTSSNTTTNNDDFYGDTNDTESSSSSSSSNSEYTSSSSDDNDDDDSFTSGEEDSSESSNIDEQQENDDSSSYVDSSEDDDDDDGTTSSDDDNYVSISNSKEQVKVGTLLPVSNNNNQTTTTTNVRMSSQQKNTLLPIPSSNNNNNSNDDDDSSSSESSSYQSTDSESTFENATTTQENLLELRTRNEPPKDDNSLLILPSSNVTTKTNNNSSTSTNMSTLADGLEGLVMTPLVIDKDGRNNNNNNNNAGDIESESSYWKQQVRPELSGGLHVESRFLRGFTRQREVKNMKLDPKNPAVFCLQIKVENRRTDGNLLRRIRFIQRAVSGSGAISVHRMKLPQEVGQLKPNQKCFLILGLEFNEMSEKDGSLMTKFDIKSDRGSISIVIKPPLAEMLIPCCKMDKEDFDHTVEKMQGIHQRAVYSFSLERNSLSEQRKALLANLKQYANLTEVGTKKGWSSNEEVCRLVAKLPLSGLHVCVQIKCCCDKTDTGEMLVCCDSTMALNSIMELLKHAVSTK